MTESVKRPSLEKCPFVLVVEGYSDLLFFAEAFEFLGLHGQVFIKEFGGKHRLKSNIENFLTPELLKGKVAVAVILDADTLEGGEIQSLSHLLQRITGRELEHGVWWNGQSHQGEPKLGFFVVPNGKQTGEIETLVWSAWANDPQNEGPKQCIEDFLCCMVEKGHTAKSLDKGKIGALLSVKNDEDPRLGPGARANVFDFNRPEFESVLKFLRGFA